MKFFALIILFCTLSQSQHLLHSSIPLIEKPGFYPAVKILQKKTAAKLSIPRVIPKSYSDSAEFYCTIAELKQYEYQLILGYTSDCAGGNACRLGSLSGKRTVRKQITGTTDYPFDNKLAKSVKLKKGVIGYFIDATCGANCSDSQIFWQRNGWEYMVGLKAGKRSQLIEFANSAIENTFP